MPYRSNLLAVLLAALTLVPRGATAFEEARPGDRIANVELPTAAGARASLLQDGSAGVFVFVRLHQPNSKRALEALAGLKRLHAAARLVVVFPGTDDRALATRAVAAAGLEAPVLMDTDEALAGRLGVFSVPVAGIVDAEHRLVGTEYFTTIDWASTVGARLAEALSPKPAVDGRRMAQAEAPESAH